MRPDNGDPHSRTKFHPGGEPDGHAFAQSRKFHHGIGPSDPFGRWRAAKKDSTVRTPGSRARTNAGSSRYRQ